MRILKKILAIALSILMAVSMMPFTVYAATTGVANGAELKAAVESAASGDTIEFTADNTTYPDTNGALVIDVNGKDITIDLKGHTQYFRVSGETTVVYETALFVIHNGAKLTIEDSVGGGAMYMTYGANSPAYMFILKDNPTKNVTDTVHTSELVINGGKFVSDAPKYGGIAVSQNYSGASTTINDGEFETNTGSQGRRDYIINDSRGKVEINGGTFTTSKSTDYVISEGNTTETSLTINDGTFNGTMSLDTTKATTELNGGTYKTNDGAANTAVSKYLPADEVIDSTTGQIKDVDASTVARIDSAEYTSLADAVAACTSTSNTNITMVKDTTEAAPITISNGAKITINANGCEVTCTERVFIIRHGQLTFNNGTIYSTTDDGVAVYGAATDSGSNYSTFTLGTNAVINAPNYFGAMIGNNSGAAYGAMITISSTAVVNSKYGIYINGNVAEPETKTNAASISINGTINGDNAEPAIYAAGYAKWTIGSSSYTANIKAGSGIYIKSGNMTITNANITAVGQKVDYVFNGNGANGTGDAIIIDSCGYPGSIPTVTIKGGTITSANGAAVASYAKQDDPRYPDANYPVVDQVIPGTSTAVFSSDVSELAADGYKTSYDSEEQGYVIAVDETTVAKIGTKRYDTLVEAFAAVQDGETIEVIRDSEGGGIFVAQNKYPNGITVNFNGHTYTGNSPAVGSAGTQSQCFHLEKGNKITMNDGFIRATGNEIKMLVQNYSDLTLNNMDLSFDQAGRYTLSNNNGNTVINNSTISATGAGGYAFDVCRYASYPSVNVTVTGNSVINGNVEVYASNNDAKNGFSLILEGGELNGDILVTPSAYMAMETSPEVTEITKADTFEQAAPAGYEWVSNDNGTSSLALDTHTVATIGDAKYDSLVEAFAAAHDGDTIEVIRDSEGGGIFVAQNKYPTGITVNFNGFTYTGNSPAVGSAGTQSQCFHLEKGNTITMNNGIIRATGNEIKMLVQNYSDLTLNNMDLSFGQAGRYTLSNNNGNVVINNSTISATGAGGYAFDVCRYASYPSVNVTVTGNSVINGNVEVSASSNNARDGFSLTLEDGELNGDIVIDSSAAAAMEASPEVTEIKKSDDFSQAAPAGYEWVSNNDGTSSLKEVEDTPEFNNPTSLTLRDNIAVNYYLEATDLEPTDTVNFTYNHNSNADYDVDNQTESASVSQLTDLVTIGGKNYYRLSFEAAPAQLSEQFTVEVIRGGNAIYNETTSMAAIAKAGKEQYAGTDPAQSALFAAVLDYATAGQKAFGYTDRASEGFFDGYYNDVAGTTVTGAYSENNNSNLAIVGATIVSISKTKVRFYYTGDATSATVALDNAYGTGTYTATLGSNDKGNYVEISGIESANLDNTFTLTINDATGSYEITASAFTIAKMLSTNASTAAEQELGKTLYNYGNAAQAFFVG